MPYIHWERVGTLSEITNVLKKTPEQRRRDSPTDSNMLLLSRYLDRHHDPDRRNPLHTRRTLDQYTYYNLKDTTERDGDQLFTRFLRREYPDTGEDNLRVLMVDQLWLWQLNYGRILRRGDFRVRL